MLPRIETSDVLRRVLNDFSAHNEKCELKEVIQKTKNGERRVFRRIGLIREQMTTSFYAILTDYVFNYQRSLSMVPDGIYSMENLPALRTNSIKLSNFCRCTDRTIRNHISFLVDFGILTKKFHGRQQDFELWISPKYLWSQETNSDENPETKKGPQTLDSTLANSQRKNLPAHYTHLENLETKTNNADMCEKHMGLFVHGENDQIQTGGTESNPEPITDASVKHGEENFAPAAAADRKAIAAQNLEKQRKEADLLFAERYAEIEANRPKMPNGKDGQQLSRNFAEMLAQFWMHAIEGVYKHRNFTKEETEKALAAIMSGVYSDFEDKRTARKWDDFQEYQLAKLDKASKYFAKYPDAYPPDPYGRYRAGTGYFDLANTRGFVGVEKWMKADQDAKVRRKNSDLVAKKKKIDAAFKRAEDQRQLDIQCEKLLKKARLDFRRLRRNEISPDETEIFGKGEIALFQFYNTIFEGKSITWQQKFCDQYMDEQARNFEDPKKKRQTRARKATVRKEADVVIVEPWMNGDGEGYYIS